MPLTSHGRREAEIDQALHESNTRFVIRLVDSYGLSAADKRDLADELRRSAVLTLADHPEATGVADIWEPGRRASILRERG